MMAKRLSDTRFYGGGFAVPIADVLRANHIALRRTQEVRALTEADVIFSTQAAIKGAVEDGKTANDIHQIIRLGATMRRVYMARSLTRCTTVLDFWAAFVPSRISNEILGDYLEDINRRAARGQRKLLYVRVVAAVFWTGVNTFGYLRKKLGKRKGT